MRFTRQQNGFTIIEMLTVIAIIGVLAALIFPVVASAKRKAKEAQCISNMHGIFLAVKQFQLDEHRYPDFIAGPVQWRDSQGNLNCVGSGEIVPLKDTNGVFNGQIVSLYPEYIDEPRGLTCPVSGVNAESAEYTATGNSPQDIVADPMFSILGSGSKPINGLRAVGPASNGNMPFYLYKYSSYDVQLPKDNTPNTFEAHYAPTRVDMDGVDPSSDPKYAKQLRWKMPPADTVVTWCSYHRDAQPGGAIDEGSKDIVLFLDGSTKKVPSRVMDDWVNAWQVSP